MTFLAPIHLWWLLAAAVLLVAYLLMQRRRTEYALRFSNLALLEHVVPQASAWRRHDRQSPSRHYPSAREELASGRLRQ